jgi:hypothetical protein
MAATAPPTWCGRATDERVPSTSTASLAVGFAIAVGVLVALLYDRFLVAAEAPELADEEASSQDEPAA